MAKYICELSSTTKLSDTDVLVIDDGTHNYKIAWSAFKALLGTVSKISSDENGAVIITLGDGTTVSTTPHDVSKQDKLTFDNIPTMDSDNPVTSNGIKVELDKKLNTTDYSLFQGATDTATGAKGIVPAPSKTSQYLSSEGAWKSPDVAPVEGSNNLITSGAVKTAMDNIEIDVDSALSDSSTNPVQNKVITLAMKDTSQANKVNHLGFYLDANGDLSYDY